MLRIEAICLVDYCGLPLKKLLTLIPLAESKEKCLGTGYRAFITGFVYPDVREFLELLDDILFKITCIKSIYVLDISNIDHGFSDLLAYVFEMRHYKVKKYTYFNRIVIRR